MADTRDQHRAEKWIVHIGLPQRHPGLDRRLRLDQRGRDRLRQAGDCEGSKAED